MHARPEAPRRSFLKWLAASPLVPSVAGWDVAAAHTAAHPPWTRPENAGQVLDVFDMERAARETLPAAHFGYVATGVDGEAAQAGNRSAFERIHLRPRRLVDVSRLDTRVRLFDHDWPTPIVLAPAGSQRALHADGELSTARAALALAHLMALSTVSSTGIEAVNEARGEPVWYQLYATSNWEVTKAIVDRTRRAGCPVLVLTVDLPVYSNRLTQIRWARIDDRDCSGCHSAGGDAPPIKPMFRETPLGAGQFFTPGMTWDIIARLRDITDQRIVVKGLVTREDALLALENGVDGIWVSNHGGRSLGSERATIDALPEIVEVAGGTVPIIVDGGVRRGTDVFKALARGATAVAIGRPYLWGLAAFGQPGVERVMDVLVRELATTMRHAGTPSLAGIGPAAIGVDNLP